MQKKQLLALGIIGGGLLLIGGWIFLYRWLISDNSIAQADIAQPTDTDILGSGNALQSGNTIHHEDNPEKDTSVPQNVPQDTHIPLEAHQATGVNHNLPDITIIVPPHIPSNALQKLRNEIYKTHHVLANFEQTKTFQAYEELLIEQQTTPTADMILLPSNRLESYKTWGAYITTEQPLSPLFHTSLAPLVDNPMITFIPFALDPYVTVYDNTFLLPYNLTIGTIQQQLLKLISKETYPIAITFGITPADLFLIAQAKQAYPEYADILAIIIADAIYKRNTYGIEYFLQSGGWDTTIAVKTARELQNEDIACVTMTHICLLKHRQAGIIFSRMSMLALSEKILDWKYTDQASISSLPVDNNHYPVTARGFLVNKQTQYKTSTTARLRGYLEHAGFGNIPLWKYTLSAFSTTFKQQNIQEPYASLLNNIDTFNILQGPIEQIKVFSQDSTLQSMLAGDYSKIIYIKEKSEEK